MRHHVGMKRGFGIAAAWVAATLISVLIATAAVGSVRDRVTDEPTAVATTSPGPSPTGTTVPPTTTTPPTTTSVPPATTTTTVPPTTTTPPESRRYDLIGGSVVALIGDGTVSLQSAVPAPGFSVEAKATGPDEVEVEFRSDEHRSKFKADWEDGELRIDIDEKNEGEDDDGNG